MSDIPSANTELLLQSAPLAWQWAPRLCQRDPATGENCAWTHGFWQILRLLGLVGSIDNRAGFFSRALDRIDARTPRVLLSGAADYATLAFVMAGFEKRKLKPQITMVDLCETPLALNRWYAERIGCTIETVRCNILDYTAAIPFDVICTDAFLGRFPRTGRGLLAARWRELLRPGGIAITYNRLRPAGGDQAVGFTPAQADALVASIRETAGALATTFGIDIETLAQHARIYTARHSTYPVQSQQELRELFEGAGFRVDGLESPPVSAAGAQAVSGPSIRDGGHYAGIVASRL